MTKHLIKLPLVSEDFLEAHASEGLEALMYAINRRIRNWARNLPPELLAQFDASDDSAEGLVLWAVQLMDQIQPANVEMKYESDEWLTRARDYLEQQFKKHQRDGRLKPAAKNLVEESIRSS